MLYNAKSRRQFLAGAGPLVLGLPVLPSLMPRSAWSAPIRSPLRFVMMQNYYGQSPKYWPPRFKSLDTLAPGVKGAKLTDLNGPISKVLGPAFDGLKSKMNVVSGLSVMHGLNWHQATCASCACSVDEALGLKYVMMPVTRQPSIQYILANSPKVYPDSNDGGVRFIGVTRAYAGGGIDFDTEYDTTFDPKGKHMGVLKNAKALYQKFAGSFNTNGGTMTNPTADPIIGPRIKMVQDVYQDYKVVVASGQLSAADRPRFESYMALIAELEKSLSTPAKSCSDPKPALAAEGGGGDPVSLSDPTNGYTAGDRDCAKILAAALACQLTSVCDFNIIPNGGQLHYFQHNGVEDKHSDWMAAYAKGFAYLWTVMDGLKDADGNTVLDNSLCVFTNGDGMTGHFPVDAFGAMNFGAHSVVDLPIATAGSLGGRIKTGYHLDYSLFALQANKTIGSDVYNYCRPYNNFLITIFKAFGLKPSDYETVPGQGYGQYAAGRIRAMPPELLTPEGRNAPLPFLLKV